MTKERITDAYYNDNKIKDKIDLSEKEIKINFLKMYGYNKVIVKISHQVKEYDNGWQCIAIFNYKDADKDYKNLIVENDSQSYSEDLNPNFSEENCTIGEFDLEKLLSTPYFYIRYRGSGKHGDDWINKDVNITVIFSMR